MARGGVPIARRLAELLGGKLDVVLCHKLRSPDGGRAAIGSISLGDAVLLESPAAHGVDPDYLAAEAQLQGDALRRREAEYEGLRAPVDPRGRVTVIVDDGVASGATLIAALRAVRARKPAWLIVAAAVASVEAAQRLEQEADRVFFLRIEDEVRDVGDYFTDYTPVDEVEIRAALARPFGDRALRTG